MFEFIYNFFPCLKPKKKKIIWIIGENDILNPTS